MHNSVEYYFHAALCLAKKEGRCVSVVGIRLSGRVWPANGNGMLSVYMESCCITAPIKPLRKHVGVCSCVVDKIGRAGVACG